MSFNAISAAWDRSEASGTKLLVLLAIADFASLDGVCFAFVQTLAEKARCDEKTVRRAIRELQDAHELDVWEWYDKHSGRRRNCYRVLLGELAAFRGQEPEDIRERATIMRVRVPTATRRRVFSRDGWRCVQCETKVGLTIDHVIPVDAGGGNEDENLQTLCGPCNLRKSAALPPGMDARPGEMSARLTGQDARSERDEMSARIKKKGPVKGTVKPLRRSAPRKKDPVWDTLAELYGEPAPHETSLRGKIGRDLRAAMPDATDEEVAKEIRRRAQAYRAAWPSVAFTDTALRARWTTLGQMLEAGQGRAGRSAAEKARDWINSVGWQIADESDVRQMLRDFGLDEVRIARALTYRDEIAAEKRRERETAAAASDGQQLSG